MEYPGESATREEVEELLLQNDFATEAWMNVEYLIDYRVEDLNGIPRVQVLLHKGEPFTNYKFEIQQYISEELFELSVYESNPPFDENLIDTDPEDPYIPDTGRGGYYSDEFEKSATRSVLPFLFIIILLGTVLFVGRKHRSAVKARLTQKDIQWARSDWAPPTLEVASFRKDGFVAEDLDDVEAAVLIGIPYNTILTVILYKLIEKGYLEEISTEPLRVRQIKGQDLTGFPQYEKLMYAAAADEEFSEQELETILKWLVDTVRAKTWNCDIEATKEYYKKNTKMHIIQSRTMKITKNIERTMMNPITTIGITII